MSASPIHPILKHSSWGNPWEVRSENAALLESYYSQLLKCDHPCCESGNIAVQISLQKEFDGAILMAPMVKVNEAMKPPEFVIDLLK